MPGPVLVNVAANYEGRDSRWFKAVRESFVDRLSTPQKVRMGTRLGVRSMRGSQLND